MKKDTEKTLRYIEDAKIVKPSVRKPTISEDPDLMLEFKSMISGSAFRKT